MKITEITVGYSQKQSLPNYSNVEPSLTLTAEIEEGDDINQVYAELSEMARLTVRDEIDNCLILHGREPLYRGKQEEEAGTGTGSEDEPLDIPF